MKKVIILFALILTGFASQAQSTIRMTYNELVNHYNSNSKLIDWQKGFTPDEVPYITYSDKRSSSVIYSYFYNGTDKTVTRYSMVDRQNVFSTWYRLLNENYELVGHNKWRDNSGNCLWTLNIDKNGLAVMSCEP